ncbi:MAG TPA: glycerol-3-phosphate dehydrogenase/oxidase [Actinomycetota bacterium]|nr:glycerol-3-phosphate dehydrogenase/oxidase [Actinomycetota bacterium]
MGSPQITGLGSRAAALESLRSTARNPLDVLVVGGGITGAGIALDAASRGFSVGLAERLDFASGTSSKSSKLVHGGLRYLEQREFALMREACTERDLLRRLAPHLVEPIPFVLPASHRSTRAKFGVGLWAYDALASFRNLKIHKHVEGSEAEALVPAFPRGKLRGAYVFYDCKTDDVRLVMENLVQAKRYGAVSANYCMVRDIVGSDRGCIATVEDTVSDEVFEIHAARVVSAAGVWADRVEELARPGATPRLRPSKGVHILLDRESLPLSEAAAFIPDVERKRMLFVIPWLDAVLVGTTDTPHEGTLDQPVVEATERAYCLDSLNATFGTSLRDTDIIGAYAGLRPLIAGRRDETADLSRRHAVYEISPGVIGITGGKMTTYRRMARDAVDRIADDLGNANKSRTRWIRLGSSKVGPLQAAVARRGRALGISAAAVSDLVRAYGDRAFEVLDVADATGLTQPLVDGSAPIAAVAAYSVRAEMAVSASDLLARRTRLSLIDPQAGLGSPVVGEVLARELDWTEAETARQLSAHRASVELERDLPLHPSAPRSDAEVAAG